ncbi:ABC transporter substrate-binding protein [Rhizobium binxianense]
MPEDRPMTITFDKGTMSMRTGLTRLLVSTSFAICAHAVMAQEVNKDAHLTIGWAEPIDTLNPATTGARNVGSLLTNMFDTLVWLDKDFAIKPLLATGWTISADGLKYTFNLRHDVTFHDGTKFDAAAVVANVNYINDGKTQSKIARGLLGPCKTATATAEYTVEFTCATPYAALLAQLGEPYLGMQSPAAIAKYGADLGQHPVGTGVFRMVSYQPDQSLVLERFDKYNWMAADPEHKGPSDIAGITFQIVPNSQARVSAFMSGQSQAMQQTPGVYWKSLGATGQYKQVSVPISGLGIFAPINADRFPTNELAVRKAIMYALDKTAVVQLAEAGVFPVSNAPLQPGMVGYDASLETMYSYDVKKAAQLLTEAGWTKPDKFWQKDGKTLTIDLTAISTVPSYPLLAQAIQGFLRDFGMDAKVTQMSSAAWQANNVSGGFSLTPLQYIGVDPDALHFWFLAGEYYNWSHWTNPELTALIMEGQRLTDAAKRVEIYQKAQRIIMENAVMLPIRQNIDLIMTVPNLTGVTYSGGGFEYFGAASLSK